MEKEPSTILEVLQYFFDLITSLVDIILNTTERIDSIYFDKTIFQDYLGYAHYAMGSSLYMLFTSVILISIGVTLWTYILKGIGLLKNLLP